LHPSTAFYQLAEFVGQIFSAARMQAMALDELGRIDAQFAAEFFGPQQPASPKKRGRSLLSLKSHARPAQPKRGVLGGGAWPDLKIIRPRLGRPFALDQKLHLWPRERPGRIVLQRSEVEFRHCEVR
jgi:hypothetical protein